MSISSRVRRCVRARLILTTYLLCSLVPALGNAVELTATCPSGAMVTASVNPKVKKFPLLAILFVGHESRRIAGKLRIENPSPSAIQYTNREVRLAVGEGAPVVAYLFSPASHVVDHDYITVEANQTIVLRVYWVSKLSAGTRVDNLRLDCILLAAKR